MHRSNSPILAGGDDRPRWRQKSKRAAFWPKWLMMLCGLSMIPATGCSIVQNAHTYIKNTNHMDDCVMSYRNRAWATKAWHQRKQHFCNQRYLHDFSKGFLAGYQSVASGGNGCTPTFPDREYWSWKYQSPEGQGKVAAWFAGFPHGARAAEEDGIGNWSQIQTSVGSHQEYAQFGLMAPNQVGAYPVAAPSAWGVPAGTPGSLGPGATTYGEMVPAESPIPGATRLGEGVSEGLQGGIPGGAALPGVPVGPQSLLPTPGANGL